MKHKQEVILIQLFYKQGAVFINLKIVTYNRVFKSQIKIPFGLSGILHQICQRLFSFRLVHIRWAASCLG